MGMTTTNSVKEPQSPFIAADPKSFAAQTQVASSAYSPKTLTSDYLSQDHDLTDLADSLLSSSPAMPTATRTLPPELDDTAHLIAELAELNDPHHRSGTTNTYNQQTYNVYNTPHKDNVRFAQPSNYHYSTEPAMQSRISPTGRISTLQYPSPVGSALPMNSYEDISIPQAVLIADTDSYQRTSKVPEVQTAKREWGLGYVDDRAEKKPTTVRRSTSSVNRPRLENKGIVEIWLYSSRVILIDSLGLTQEALPALRKEVSPVNNPSSMLHNVASKFRRLPTLQPLKNK